MAVLLAEGRTVPQIAALSKRAESSILTHVKRIHRKLGVSRRVDLVRLLLPVSSLRALRRVVPFVPPGPRPPGQAAHYNQLPVQDFVRLTTHHLTRFTISQ